MSRPAVDGFERLTDTISISRPGATKTTTRSQAQNAPSGPQLIVYCSWMSAAPKHIAKYTAGWRREFPAATILLVEYTLRDIIIPQDLTAAFDVINEHMITHGSIERADGSAHNGIVLATASNGGAFNAMRLSDRLQHVHEHAQFDAVVLDCGPGLPTISLGARAMTASVAGNNAVLGFVVYYLFCVLLAVYIGVHRVFIGGDERHVKLRKHLNDISLFNRTTPKLYLYSKADQMVDWESVHAHAQEAREKRKVKVVREEVFERAPHVALLTEDSERYWKAVREVVLGT